jgi:hypothetical protein
VTSSAVQGEYETKQLLEPKLLYLLPTPQPCQQIFYLSYKLCFIFASAYGK